LRYHGARIFRTMTTQPCGSARLLQRLSSEANHVGSPHDKANAEFVRDQYAVITAGVLASATGSMSSPHC
jgi:hypothetical protein